MRYKITSPVRGFRGEVAGVAFAGGTAEIGDQAPRALAYFRRKGYTVTELETRPPAAPASHGDEPRRPGKNASKDELVAYAVAELDLAEDDAKAKTRVELLDLIDKHDKESEQ